MRDKRPIGRSIVWILLLGGFFFTSYGFANWFASTRDNVGSIVFGWEHLIPFVPWTIVPYWSIDLLYGFSLLICTSRRELDRQAQRLVAIQLISIPFFLAFPLRFSFERPVAIDGIFGAMFAALGNFDKPFNQAPSLHIGLLVVIWATLARHTRKVWRPFLHAWMMLIGVSVLTTYQHHFLDIPTGLAVGFLVLWALPAAGPSPLSRLMLADDPRRWRIAGFYAAGATISGLITTAGGALLWFWWPAGSLALMALAYAVLDEQIFQKQPHGRLSMAARVLFAPYLLGAWVNSRIWTLRGTPSTEVADGVFLGRFPSASELTRSQFAAIVDLTGEFSCVPGDRFYRSIPVLDMTVPSIEQLHDASSAIEEGRVHGSVLVCCALGVSRSATAIVAWLLLTNRVSTLEAAEASIREIRPSIVLLPAHRARLESFQ